MSVEIREAIRDIPNFPMPGIIFKDITPVLANPDRFHSAIDLMCAPHHHNPPSRIVGIDARGFIFGAAMADRLGAEFIPVRKTGKLPWQTKSSSYQLEYGEAEIEIHEDALSLDDRVLIVDDLLATGGTAAATIQLVSHFGCQLSGLSVLVELTSLNGRHKLPDCPVWSVVDY